MARNSQSGSKNNNPEGRNQYSGGFRDMARERPFTTAAAAAATVGAGVFLWSRRNQISEQLGNLSDQIGTWTENMNSNRELESVGSSSNMSSGSSSNMSSGSEMSSASSGGKRGSRGSSSTSMGEVGGGNASLGSQTGGSGTMSGGSNTNRS